MRYAQLRAFHNVALYGGFSRAADNLHLTQPAISDQVGKLETQYDTLLFNRSGNRTVLTASGRRLFDCTTRLFEAETSAREFLSDTRAELSGQIRLVVDSACHVAGMLAGFRKTNPEVRIRLRSGNTEEVMRSLFDYEAEIGVVGNLPKSKGIRKMTLGTAQVVAIVAANHPLAAAGEATLGELAGYPFVLREPGSRTREVVETAAGRMGVGTEDALEAEGREAVRELVAAGLGVGFVSESEMPDDAGLAKIGVIDPRFIMEEHLVHLTRRRDSPMIRSFMRSAVEWQHRLPGAERMKALP